jgi:hypothetical protein
VNTLGEVAILPLKVSTYYGVIGVHPFELELTSSKPPWENCVGFAILVTANKCDITEFGNLGR